MRAKDFITEQQGLRLKHLAQVNTNFPDADFWLRRRGSIDSIGKPTKEFSEENIGIKVTALDKVDPNWLYYVMLHLYNQGYFKQFAGGMLKLVHLPTDVVKNISFSPTNENYLAENI